MRTDPPSTFYWSPVEQTSVCLLWLERFPKRGADGSGGEPPQDLPPSSLAASVAKLAERISSKWFPTAAHFCRALARRTERGAPPEILRRRPEISGDDAFPQCCNLRCDDLAAPKKPGVSACRRSRTCILPCAVIICLMARTGEFADSPATERRQIRLGQRPGRSRRFK